MQGLIDKVTKIFEDTQQAYGNAWIPAIDGRKIFVDSKHKALNYLLQSCEGVTCKAAIAAAMNELEDRGIPYEPRIFMHDEFQIEVPDEYEEVAKEICQRAFRDAPKQFGVMIMNGEAKSGNNWYETH